MEIKLAAGFSRWLVRLTPHTASMSQSVHGRHYWHFQPVTLSDCNFVILRYYKSNSCQPLSGVNLSPESLMQAGVFCFFAGGSGILDSNWHVWQSGKDMRSNVVWNTHVQLQISLPTIFLSLLHWASQCVFGDGMSLSAAQSFDSFQSFCSV